MCLRCILQRTSRLTYFAILTCRNSQESIERAVSAIYEQTVQPQYVIVINDGSTDGTHEKLDRLRAKYDHLHVINLPDNGHDTSRVVFNWNKALALAETLPKCDYHLIATDDIIPESRYVEKLLKALENERLAIVSGTYRTDMIIESPHGAGRMVRNDFFQYTMWRGRYPEKMGYESAIVYEAMRLGYTCRNLGSAYFDHTRRIGKNHKFRNFGAGMKTLDYHPLFVLGRFAVYFARGKPLGRVGACQMFWSYLKAKPDAEGFNSKLDPRLRAYIRSTQLKSIRAIRLTRTRKRLLRF